LLGKTEMLRYGEIIVISGLDSKRVPPESEPDLLRPATSLIMREMLRCGEVIVVPGLDSKRVPPESEPDATSLGERNVWKRWT
jgi:hypothetical protein